MKRVVLAAAIALLSLAATHPALAEENGGPDGAAVGDPWAELVELGQWARSADYGRPIGNVYFATLQCQTPDPADVKLAMEQSDAVASRATDLARVLPGDEHLEALKMAAQANRDFWSAANATLPERCYLPPAT